MGLSWDVSGFSDGLGVDVFVRRCSRMPYERPKYEVMRTRLVCPGYVWSLELL